MKTVDDERTMFSLMNRALMENDFGAAHELSRAWWRAGDNVKALRAFLPIQGYAAMTLQRDVLTKAPFEADFGFFLHHAIMRAIATTEAEGQMVLRIYALEDSVASCEYLDHLRRSPVDTSDETPPEPKSIPIWTHRRYNPELHGMDDPWWSFRTISASFDNLFI